MREPLLPLRRSFRSRLEMARDLGIALFQGIHPRSALTGPPTEFDGHRPYLPGDDTRWIDWNIFARSEELFVKVFQVEEEIEAAIMLDVSPSMKEGGRKADVGAAAAAALCYLALFTDHSLSLLRYGEKTIDMVSPCRSLQAFPMVSQRLLEMGGGEGTDLGQSLRPFLLGRRRAVSVVAVTDGFQRKPLEAVAETVRTIGEHRLTVVLLQDEADLRPRLRGQMLLSDPEGAGRRAIISNQSLEKQLHHRIENHFRDLRARLKLLGAETLHLNCRGSFEEEFMTLLSACAPHREKVGYDV